MQQALEKVSANGLQNEEYNRRLFEQKLADFQDEMALRNQSLAKEHLVNIDGVKNDIKRQADQDQKRMYAEFEKLVQKTSNGIEQTINSTLVP